MHGDEGLASTSKQNNCYKTECYINGRLVLLLESSGDLEGQDTVELLRISHCLAAFSSNLLEKRLGRFLILSSTSLHNSHGQHWSRGSWRNTSHWFFLNWIFRRPIFELINQRGQEWGFCANKNPWFFPLGTNRGVYLFELEWSVYWVLYNIWNLSIYFGIVWI